MRLVERLDESGGVTFRFGRERHVFFFVLHTLKLRKQSLSDNNNNGNRVKLIEIEERIRYQKPLRVVTIVPLQSLQRESG